MAVIESCDDQICRNGQHLGHGIELNDYVDYFKAGAGFGGKIDGFW